MFLTKIIPSFHSKSESSTLVQVDHGYDAYSDEYTLHSAQTKETHNDSFDNLSPPKGKLAAVQRLRYEHIDKATDSIMDAFANDPLQVYVRADVKRKFPLGKKIYKAIFASQVASSVEDKLNIAYTVNDGDAVCVATRSKDEAGERPPLRKLLNFLFGALFGGILRAYRTKEQEKRLQEVQSVMKETEEKTLGDRRDQMIYINLLATAPAAQGKGYGSSLVAAVTSIADMQGRATYLFSSNIKNTGFYNSRGFVSVAEARIGENNPAWHKLPVVVPLMVREAKSDYTREKGDLLV